MPSRTFVRMRADATFKTTQHGTLKVHNNCCQYYFPNITLFSNSPNALAKE